MIYIMLEGFVEQLVARSNRRLELRQGAFLFHQGDRVKSVFIVDEGQIDLCRHRRDGTSIVLQSVNRQSILAEASVYAETYHCDAVAASSSVVFQLRRTRFRNYLQTDDDFAVSWAAHLAREVQAARSKIEVLSHRSVANRLDCWLAWPGNELPGKGRWKEMAFQIGVSPEALYRELKKRRLD